MTKFPQITLTLTLLFLVAACAMTPEQKAAIIHGCNDYSQAQQRPAVVYVPQTYQAPQPQNIYVYPTYPSRTGITPIPYPGLGGSVDAAYQFLDNVNAPRPVAY